MLLSQIMIDGRVVTLRYAINLLSATTHTQIYLGSQAVVEQLDVMHD